MYMRPIVTDRVVSSVGLSVCLSVTLVSPAKTGAPTEMPFGLWAQMSRGKHVLSERPQVLTAEGRCHGNEFWDAICYNWLCGYFSCMIDSETMFDSG